MSKELDAPIVPKGVVGAEWIGEVFNLFNVANLRGYDTQRILPTTSDCAAAACTASEISTLGFLQPTDRATSAGSRAA